MCSLIDPECAYLTTLQDKCQTISEKVGAALTRLPPEARPPLPAGAGCAPPRPAVAGTPTGSGRPHHAAMACDICRGPFSGYDFTQNSMAGVCHQLKAHSVLHRGDDTWYIYAVHGARHMDCCHVRLSLHVARIKPPVQTQPVAEIAPCRAAHVRFAGSSAVSSAGCRKALQKANAVSARLSACSANALCLPRCDSVAARKAELIILLSHAPVEPVGPSAPVASSRARQQGLAASHTAAQNPLPSSLLPKSVVPPRAHPWAAAARWSYPATSASKPARHTLQARTAACFSEVRPGRLKPNAQHL